MSAGEWAIRAEGVSKKFGLTLRQSMKYGMRDVGRKLFGRSSTTDVLREGEFWAVNDVGFELHRGEALGIMGVNGCGKTTLLRILNGVYAPDKGCIEVKGRVGALIAAGAGFAPMLTGRENVYVNGTLLGLSTKEIDGLMDEIVAFSELGEFIDLPVKNYSSGMFVRLGFAIAALSRPDVLLMDEVLAVGDLNFQKKCFDHVLQLKRQGSAIILVSHSPGAIWSVCDRGLFMDRGRVLVDGPVEDAIRAYDDQNSRNANTSSAQFDKAVEAHGEATGDSQASEYGHTRGGTGDVVCTAIHLTRPSSDEVDNEFDFRESIEIAADLEVKEMQENLLLRFTIDAVHYRFIATLDSYEQGLSLPEVLPGRYRLKVRVDAPNFRPGAYVVNIGITRKAVGVHLFYWFGATRFVVKHPKDLFLYADNNAVMHLDSTFTLIPTPAKTASTLEGGL
ncbi:ATP-binding cassette domain-containing protein [Rhizobium leguminosarum bv. viciae]|uniref:ATP-binding cassette domain-containing protein n=1 Tax=Rhizobium leguminosarum bv. viciae TaxID=387 RepID=A0A8I2KJK1_RHILV|nr:ABC transporter ATP-binding protein [Rhizobium leguminosarum]NKM50172.1 ATP-binding cassette domain-containing protein [Rhizobium leguminosarum bv. viciae]